MAFGNNVHTVIILDFPQNSRGVTWIQMVYSLAIMLSVPLQLFPAIKIMEHWIFNENSGKINSLIKWLKNCVLLLAIAIASILAYRGSDSLDMLVSFAGCFACIPFVYIYPPLMHIKVCNTGIASKWLDIVIMGMGSITLCYAISQIFTR